MELAEQFNKNRMNKCLEVFKQIVTNWMKTNQFQCRIVTDEPVEGKSLEELGKSYFDVGLGDQLTTLPFLDTLIVMKLIKDHASRKVTSPRTEQYTVTTAFTDEDAFGLLDEMHNKIGIEFINKSQI